MLVLEAILEHFVKITLLVPGNVPEDSSLKLFNLKCRTLGDDPTCLYPEQQHRSLGTHPGRAVGNDWGVL